MTETILDKIKAHKLMEIASDKATMPVDLIEGAARNADTVRPFADSLARAQTNGYGLIAEIKKASPSKGRSATTSIRQNSRSRTSAAAPPVFRF